MIQSKLPRPCAGLAMLVALTSSAQAKTWELIWSDEFDGPAKSAPDPKKWAFSIGGGGWGNHELETYTSRRDNSFLDGKGNLVIEAKRERFTGPDGITRNYTGGLKRVCNCRLARDCGLPFGRLETTSHPWAGRLVAKWTSWRILAASHPPITAACTDQGTPAEVPSREPIHSPMGSVSAMIFMSLQLNGLRSRWISSLTMFYTRPKLPPISQPDVSGYLIILFTSS